MRLIFPAVALMSLSACATYQGQIDDTLAQIPADQHAYIAGSFSVDCYERPLGGDCWQGFTHMWFMYRSLDYPEVVGRLISEQSGIGDTEYDWVDIENGETGVFFCAKMPAGKYEAYDISLANLGLGDGTTNLDKDEQFSVPFELEAGAVTYIGGVKMTSRKGKNLFGLPVFGFTGVEISNGREGGFEKALEKCGALPDSIKKVEDLLPANYDGNSGWVKVTQ